jgi:hypothetical protein
MRGAALHGRYTPSTVQGSWHKLILGQPREVLLLFFVAFSETPVTMLTNLKTHHLVVIWG